jgi:hypothetical protein
MMRWVHAAGTMLATFVAAVPSVAQTPSRPNESSKVDTALARVVYRLDETPSGCGYHYVFYGNAFFINDNGYLLTVAHVIDNFRDGGQPFILVSRLNSPPRLIPITVIATDPGHDVAILQAKPNPFVNHFQVVYLRLRADGATRDESVLALSLHPPRLQNAQSFEAPTEDRSPGKVLSYETTQLDRGAAGAEVLLLSHPVVKGQSGSPVIAVAADGSPAGVVGLIEGRWLRGTALAARAITSDHPTDVPGVAIPIQYALDLLKGHHIAYNTPP